MANLPISGLTASAANLTATDVMPVVQTTGVGPVKMTGLQLAGGLLGSTALTGATVTTDKPVLDLSQTWNAAGVTFTGMRFNAAGTSNANSAVGSLLLDLQVGGTSIFSARKDGLLFANSVTGNQPSGLQITRAGVSNSGGAFLVQYSFARIGARVDGVAVDGSVPFGFSSGRADAGTIDTILTRADTATLQLGNADTTGTTAPTPQKLRVQSWSSSTNANQAGADFTIQGSRGTGTGAGGSIIFQVAPAGSSGTAQNAYSTALTIDSSRNITIGGDVVYSSGASLKLGIAGLPVAGVGVNYFALTVDTALRWTSSSTIDPSATADLVLRRDAANTLALRNGANAQTFNLYETYTDASNYSRLAISYDSGSSSFRIAPQAAGTGSPRNITLAPANGLLNITASSVLLDGNRQLRWGTTPVTYINPRDNTANDINFGLNAASPLACTIGGCGGRSGADTDTAGANFIVRGGLGTGTGAGGNLQFAVGLPGTTGNASNPAVNIAYFAGASGHMLWNTDNTYDIGASGATRPRSIYAGTSIVTPAFSGSTYTIAATGYVVWSGRSLIYSPADGNVRLTNNAGTGFGLLQFGSTTSSFPALKRSSATLQARLADDSDFAPVQGKLTTETAYTAGAPTATGYLVLYDSNGTAYKVPAVAV